MKNAALTYWVFECMPTLAPALGSEGGQARVTWGSSMSLVSAAWTCRRVGTHRERAVVLNPQSSSEVGEAFWLGRGRGGFQDLLWERRGRGSQPYSSILFNLIPRANRKQVPTEPCRLEFGNTLLAVRQGKEPSELQMTGIAEGHTHLFFNPPSIPLYVINTFKEL